MDLNSVLELRGSAAAPARKARRTETASRATRGGGGSGGSGGGMQQMYLDLGQRGTGVQTCAACGMVFQHTVEDAALHRRFCAGGRGGGKVPTAPLTVGAALRAAPQPLLNDSWQLPGSAWRCVSAADLAPIQPGAGVVTAAIDAVLQHRAAGNDLHPDVPTTSAAVASMRPAVQWAFLLDADGRCAAWAAFSVAALDDVVTAVSRVDDGGTSGAASAGASPRASPDPLHPDSPQRVVVRQRHVHLAIADVWVAPARAVPKSFFAKPSATAPADDGAAAAVLDAVLQYARYGCRVTPAQTCFAPGVIESSDARIVAAISAACGAEEPLVLR
jgi:hypothetical protein